MAGIEAALIAVMSYTICMTHNLPFHLIHEKAFVDIPSSTPLIKVPLQAVGVSNRPTYITICNPFDGIPCEALADVRVLFSLPAHQRGIHMSRIEECLYESREAGPLPLMQWISRFADRLIESQDQDECQVRVSAPLEKMVTNPGSGKRSIELIKIHSEIVRDRKGCTITTGVSVPFINACPCTQRWAMRDFYLKLRERGYSENEAQALVVDAPRQAHTNLGEASLRLTGTDITHARIYDVLDAAVPIVREMLKGRDEHGVVTAAHGAGQFCEDNTRALIARTVELLNGQVPSEASVALKVEVNESVHYHNLYSEVNATFGQLRDLIESSQP